MGVIGNPQPQPTGVLWWSGWYLQSFNNRLRQLAGDISGVWIVGNHLSYPFYVLASFIDGVVNNLFHADDRFQELKAWVEHIINGTGFLELLAWASGHFMLIKYNPRGWFLMIMNGFSWKLALLLQNPWQFVNMFVRELSGSIGLLLDNPLAFIHNHLNQLRWWLSMFLDNPIGFIRHFTRLISWRMSQIIDNPYWFVNDLVRLLSPNIGHFLDDTRGWLFNRLMEISFDLGQFVGNPRHYLQRQIGSILGLPDGFWIDPLYIITQTILQTIRIRLRSFTDTIKEIVVDFILEFI